MIDLKQQYRTRSGKKVVLHEIVLNNSAGRSVTFPVKGTIYTKHKVRTTKKYFIWTLTGHASVSELTDDDLIRII